MGVNGLWQVLQPCARPTNLATLNRKRLAVDASIWIYQFLKAVRDKEGNALRNSHVVGFFRRICKLLWFGILPVFVFDGGAPVLKRSTLQARRQRREGRREDAVRTAGKLLAVQMHRIAEEEADKKRKQNALPGTAAATGGNDGMADGEVLPAADQMVYVEEAHMSQRERLQSRKFTKQDAYHLPALDAGSIDGMGRPDDPRIMSIDELEDYARQFHAGEDINLYDFSKIDFDGDFFQSLPPADRYYILNAARIRSRLRMGLSKEQLDTMFPDRMAFSRFQIERVRERNHLTQRLMVEAGMSGIDLTMGINGGGGLGGINSRVAGERNREYILVKNDGAEGGWALGVVSRDKEQGQMHKPIDVDALQFRYDGDKGDDEDEDEDLDFQDVPIEGLNRLPTRPIAPQLPEEDADEDSMFVKSYEPTGQPTASEDQRDTLLNDEDEDLSRAIAMSLQNQHGVGAEDDADDEEFEDVDIPAPEWNQKAVDTARPIMATSGKMVAHIVNNRANAAVSAAAAASKARESAVGTTKKTNVDDDDSSDSELDIRAAMAKAARKKSQKPDAVAQPTPAPTHPIRPQVKNPFDGPLPFEKLDWRTSIFERNPTTPAVPKQQVKQPASTSMPPFASSISENAIFAAKAAAAAGETGELEPEESDDEDDELAGGFEKPMSVAEDEDADEEDEAGLEGGFERDPAAVDDSAPRPLPPWMMHNTDIRTAVRQQQAYDDEINAEDREMARQEAQIWQRREEERVVQIDSSSEDGSDLEVLDALPPPKKKSPPAVVSEEPEGETDAVMVDVPIPETYIIPVAPAEKAVEGHANNPQDSGAVEEPVVLLGGSRSSSPEMAFEDVELPNQPTALEPETRDDGVVPQVEEKVFESATEVTTALAEDVDDDGLFTAEGAAGGNEEDDEFAFSDPEHEELLAQMAEEAEEHARFASELNHRTTQENQVAYEEELKALRSQQKKDRRDADEVTQIMVSECQALLRLFGIPYITAPMEAEAQCAELVSLGLVDGIVTDDSDTFLFGGTRVYKNMFNGNKFVECYLGTDLEKELSLSREQLIGIAQLLGSDYTDGLPGVGPVTAMEILSEFPGEHGLDEFRAWWEDVQGLNRSKEADAQSTFRRKFRKSQATKLFLPPGFPSQAVVDAYLQPEVDRSTEPFQWGVPDLGGLRTFLMATIGWSQERTDEVLVPVIRDMNRRETEGTQSNITRFFSGSVGVGARQSGKQDKNHHQLLQQQKMPYNIPEEYAPRHAPRNKTTASSRRMAAAVSKLKAAGAAQASATAEPEQGSTEPNGGAPTTGRKRKARGRASSTQQDEETVDVEEYAEGGEADDAGSHEDGGDGEYKEGATVHRRTAKKRGGKKSKAS